MSIYELKPTFQNLLRPLVNTLARGGISANQITLSAMLLSMATGMALLYWRGNEIFWFIDFAS